MVGSEHRPHGGQSHLTARFVMKVARLMVAAFLAVSVAGFAFGDDAKPAKKYKEGGCCAKAAAKGEACKHDCCVAAEKEGKVCEKCNPPAKKE